MKTKVKYLLKFLLGILFLVGVVALLYWLFAIYQVSNWIAILAVGMFLVLPLIKVLLSLPGEFVALLTILRSDNPEEVEKLVGYMREKNQL